MANLGGTKGSFYFFTIPNFDNISIGKSMAFRFSKTNDNYGHNRGDAFRLEYRNASLVTWSLIVLCVILQMDVRTFIKDYKIAELNCIRNQHAVFEIDRAIIDNNYLLQMNVRTNWPIYKKKLRFEKNDKNERKLSRFFRGYKIIFTSWFYASDFIQEYTIKNLFANIMKYFV